MNSAFIDDANLPEPWGLREQPWLTGAFTSLCGWLWERDEAHEAFCEATGTKRLSPAKSVLEHLIDQATGAGDDYARDFIAWVIREHWGEATNPAEDSADSPAEGRAGNLPPDAPNPPAEGGE